jgi:hypothetical protein
MSERSERELVRLLEEALEPPARQPPAERVAQLREQVAAAVPPAAALAPRRDGRRRRFAGALVAAAAVVVAFVAGTVVGDGGLPRPLRAAAEAIGLPVDSPELVDARRELQRLGESLAAGDAGGVAAADAAMVRLVKGLDADERARIEPVAHEVHLRAVALLAGAGGG